MAVFPIAPVTSIEPYGNGRLHRTYRVGTTDGYYILQRLSPTIDPLVFGNVHRVTAHMARKGLRTSTIVKTRNGNLAHRDEVSGTLWRLMTFITGTTIENNPTTRQAASAARFLARFHAALTDYDGQLVPLSHFHDGAYIFGRLREALAAYRYRDGYAAWRSIAECIFTLAEERAERFGDWPTRMCHGDPKINNFRFDERGDDAIALIDLDTVGCYPLPLELGDMLRSFCARRIDKGSMTVREDVWHAAFGAYRMAAVVSDEEMDAVPDGFVLVTLELAARYCIDAYEGGVFVLDTVRYASHYEKGVTRARELITLVEDYLQKESVFSATHIVPEARRGCALSPRGRRWGGS